MYPLQRVYAYMNVKDSVSNNLKHLDRAEAFMRRRVSLIGSRISEIRSVNPERLLFGRVHHSLNSVAV